MSKFEHMSLIKTTLEGMIGAHKHTELGINYFPAPHVSVDQLTKFSLPLLLKSDLKKKSIVHLHISCDYLLYVLLIFPLKDHSESLFRNQNDCLIYQCM